MSFGFIFQTLWEFLKTPDVAVDNELLKLFSKPQVIYHWKQTISIHLNNDRSSNNIGGLIIYNKLVTIC